MFTITIAYGKKNPLVFVECKLHMNQHSIVKKAEVRLGHISLQTYRMTLPFCSKVIIIDCISFLLPP